MTGATPGQAAYEAWFDAAHGFMPAPVTTAAEVWARGTGDWHATWEAAANGAADWFAGCEPPAAQQQPAPELAETPEQAWERRTQAAGAAPELAAALEDFNFERNQVIELRAVVLDMARSIRASMNGGGRIARSEVIDWMERAGVEFDVYAEPGSDQ